AAQDAGRRGDPGPVRPRVDPLRVVGPPALRVDAAGPLPHPAPPAADARGPGAGVVPDRPRLLDLPAVRRPLRSGRRVLRGARRGAGLRIALSRGQLRPARVWPSYCAISRAARPTRGP